jgi:raffinose/stachyose/melibiose transport system substrate-binding protein
MVLAFLLIAVSLSFASGDGEKGTAKGVVQITVWDQFESEGTTAAGPAMEKLLVQFQKENPDVKVKRTLVPQSNIRDQLRIAVAGGTQPNLVYTWPAAAVLASYAKDAHLLVLDQAAEKFGWLQNLPDLETKRNSYKGHLYAYPFEQDYMLVYYNKDLFAKLGISVPQTYEEFLSNNEVIKKAGFTPIAFGNRGKWPATNTLSYLLALVAGKQRQEEVLFKDTPWTNDAYVEAATIFMDWVNKDFFPKGFNGIEFGEANSLFTMGKAAMNITGTWIIKDMFRATGFQMGTFMLPQIKASLPKATMMGEGSQWEVSAKGTAAEQEAAVRLLNFLMADANIGTWVKDGYVIPLRKGGLNWDPFTVPDGVKETFRMGDAMQSVNGYDLHTTVPESVTETLYNNLQLMLDKRLTPPQFLQEMQKSWEKAKAAGEVWIP